MLPRLSRLSEQHVRPILEWRLFFCKNNVKGYQTLTIQEILRPLQHREDPGYHCIPEVRQGQQAKQAQQAQQAPVDLESYSENKKFNIYFS